MNPAPGNDLDTSAFTVDISVIDQEDLSGLVRQTSDKGTPMNTCKARGIHA